MSTEPCSDPASLLPRQSQSSQDDLTRRWLRTVPEPKRGDPDATQRNRARIMEIHDKIVALENEVPCLVQTARTTGQAFDKAVADMQRSRINLLRMQYRFLYWRNFPINKLPTEILLHILHLVASSDRSPQGTIQVRLWLTWVCSYWRTVVLADQTMWSVIWFRDNPPFARSLAWLERAGTTPLDIRIDRNDPNWSGKEDEHVFSGQQMESLINKIFKKLPQIRTLVVSVDNWPPSLVVLDKLRQAGNSGIPIRLQRFELHRSGRPYVWIGAGYKPDIHRHPIPLFAGRTESLRHLCLNGIHIDWVQTPLSNLTTIDLRRMALDVSPDLFRFRAMLEACPRLHKLALDGAGPKFLPREPQGLPPVELPLVRILVLGDFSLQYALHVLENISTPNVRDLTLMNMNGEDYSLLIANMTSGFREVKLLTLYTFEVDNTPLARVMMVKWLKSMPHIKYLRLAQVPRHILEVFALENTGDDAAPLLGTPGEVVTIEHPSPLVCPQLNILEFQYTSVDDVITLTERRKELDCPFQKIYVNGPWMSHIKVDDVRRLQQFAELFVAPHGVTTPEEIELMRKITRYSTHVSANV